MPFCPIRHPQRVFQTARRGHESDPVVADLHLARALLDRDADPISGDHVSLPRTNRDPRRARAEEDSHIVSDAHARFWSRRSSCRRSSSARPSRAPPRPPRGWRRSRCRAPQPAPHRRPAHRRRWAARRHRGRARSRCPRPAPRLSRRLRSPRRGPSAPGLLLPAIRLPQPSHAPPICASAAPPSTATPLSRLDAADRPSALIPIQFASTTARNAAAPSTPMP